MEFDEWFNKLLNVDTKQGNFGEQYPMGCCAYRDVIREPEVKEALRKAWVKHVHAGPTLKEGDKND